VIVVAALVGRVVLAMVFALAAVTKLADRAGTRRAVIEFGTPIRVAGAVAVLLPLVELSVAGLLLPAPTARAGAVAAIALLAAFTAAIATSLARGRTPECHCFGQLHSAPAGWRTIGRNAGLLAIGVIALAGSLAEPRASATGWIGELQPAELAAVAAGAAVVAVLAGGALALLALMRSYGRVLVRLDRLEAALSEAGVDVGALEAAPRVGLEPGTPAPWFLGTTPSGSGLSRDDLLAARLPVLLLFTSPHCAPCAELLPDAAAWQDDHAAELTVAFASQGSPDAVAAEAAEFELLHVVVDEQGAVAASFEAPGTPSAVLIAADGRIASWLASGRDEIEALVADAVHARSDDDEGLPIGAEAPAIELPALDGEPVALDELRGRETLLLFWNPDCGFCRAMHEDLRAWERTANGVAPRLVIVSSGDRESTAADGFHSTVVLDAEFAAGSAFGAGGTPMAVLVGADGRIASRVVAGADAVLELANRRVVEHA
jgi:thiol-disulfide isomerase/thioredoxin